MKHIRILLALSALFAFAFGSTALAGQPRSPHPTRRAGTAHQAKKKNKKNKKKVKSYDFLGDEIRGDGILPSGENVFVPRPAAHGSLIRLRKSFLAEVVRSASDVR